ncbi:uncharacterized protein LOC133186548 [Saccostrea echinata]|uniref:uncharacterized protein LOC133186548 n=1 Tax=Saccostrea echinata TaxID=191078 RepID=UPI002A834832|nr:uncharacterized protein LOC133186548 [Saccostrea echinata]
MEDESGLGKSIKRNRPTAKRPKDWTEHNNVPENSSEPSPKQDTEKASLWQKLKNVTKAKSNEEHPIKTQENATATNPSSNWDHLLNDKFPDSSNKPRPMIDIGTPIRKTREESSIPKSQSQWLQAFRAISEMKRTESNQPKPMDLKQMDRKYEPVTVNQSASSEVGRPKPSTENIDSFWLPSPRTSRPNTRQTHMEFWGAEDFCFDTVSVDPETTQDEHSWKMS